MPSLWRPIEILVASNRFYNIVQQVLQHRRIVVFLHWRPNPAGVEHLLSNQREFDIDRTRHHRMPDCRHHRHRERQVGSAEQSGRTRRWRPSPMLPEAFADTARRRASGCIETMAGRGSMIRCGLDMVEERAARLAAAAENRKPRAPVHRSRGAGSYRQFFFHVSNSVGDNRNRAMLPSCRLITSVSTTSTSRAPAAGGNVCEARRRR